MFSAAAFAAPKVQSLAVTPNPAQFSGDRRPEVEIVVSVNRGKFEKGSCDARLDFGLAATRTVHHAYSKGGSYTIAVSGIDAPKKAEPKKQAAPAKKTARKKDETK